MLPIFLPSALLTPAHGTAQSERSAPIPVVTDAFDLIDALCDVGEWELARRVARVEDERRARF